MGSSARRRGVSAPQVLKRLLATSAHLPGGLSMSIRLGRDLRSLPVILCIVTLVSVVVLLLWDVLPSLFPARAHNLLVAIPLAMIACACLVYEAVRRPSRSELIKAIDRKST